jgi:site-specific DNA-cytosine methylase
VANPSHTKDEWLGVIDVLPHLNELVRAPSMKNHWSDSRTIETPFPTVTSQSVKQIRIEALGSNANRKNDREISQPSKTICGSGNQTGARIFNHTEPKPEKIRSLTIQETLILQGFNPDYDMTAANTQKARWTMIGNAVVPAVAKAVIEGIECR